MQIQIELPRQRYLMAESITARVSITNTGDAAIEVPDPSANVNWQPRYTVSGPAYPDGYPFSQRSAVFKDPDPNPQGVEPITVALPPGQTYSEDVSLEQLVTFPEPGRYTLSARLSWDGGDAAAEPVTFTVDAPAFDAFALSVQDGLQPAFPIVLFALGGDAAQRQIYAALFKDDEQIMTARLDSIDYFAPAGADSERLISTWMNYQGMGTPSPRALWQNDREIGVAAFGQTGGPTFAPASRADAVRPALMDAGGETDLFLLDRDAGELMLVRFPADGDGEGQPAPRWRAPLPDDVAGYRAALAARGDDRRAAIIISGSAPDSGTRITAFVADKSAAAPRRRSVGVAAVGAVADAEPALYVDADGTLHAATLVTGPADDADDGRARHAVYLLTARLPDDDAPAPEPELVAVVALAEPPAAAALSFAVAADGGRRLDWVLLTADGRLINSVSAPEARTLTGAPVRPFALLGMADRSYILTVRDTGLPALEPLY